MKRDDLLDLNDVLQHPGRTLEVDLSSDLPEEGEVDLASPIEGCLEIVSTGNALIVKGEFSARCVFECARCTEPIEVDVPFTMEEEFPVEGVPSSWSHDDCAKVVSEEGFPLFDGNHLMVENLLRQGLIVSLPLQPLCSFGWDGDCPHALKHELKAPPSGMMDERRKLAQFLEQEEGE